MENQRETLLVRVSSGLKARLAEMARKERRSLSKQVEFLLERYLVMLDAGEQSEANKGRVGKGR